MFRRRTADEKLARNDTAIFDKSGTDEFPVEGRSRLSLRLKIRRVARSMRYQKKLSKIGYLFKYPSREAVSVWQKLLPYSPNNLGNWSAEQNRWDQISGKIEVELIRKMTKLYGGDTADYEGYATAGATEGNIYSAWLGRNALLKSVDTPPELVVNSLTHYSIIKAGDLLGLKHSVCPLGQKWSFDPTSLRAHLTERNRAGCMSFLLPLTVGYTLTGTSDDVDGIAEEVRDIDHTLKTRTFIWLDAALSGMIEPFTTGGFLPLKCPLVNALTVDFHKFAGVPFPAGLVLYRKGWRAAVERHVGYLDGYDSTLLGSRTGIAAIACWYMMHRLGRKGYAAEVDKKMKKKRLFLEQISKYEGVEITTSDRSLNCGVVYNNSHVDLTREIEQKYGVRFLRVQIKTLKGQQEVRIARAYFL